MPKPQSNRREKTFGKQGKAGAFVPMLKNEGDLRDGEAFVELMREGTTVQTDNETIDLWDEVINEVASEME